MRLSHRCRSWKKEGIPHHFTQADQVNQLVGASETDPDMGFMGRLMALCSLKNAVAQRSGFATPRPRTGFQGFRRCETVLQERFDWR